jgi:hypothetical protein
MVIRHIFPYFGKLHQEKSGNPVAQPILNKLIRKIGRGKRAKVWVAYVKKTKKNCPKRAIA